MIKKTNLMVITVLALCVTVPVRQAFASIPDMKPFVGSNIDFKVPVVEHVPFSISSTSVIHEEPKLLDRSTVEAILDDEEAVVTAPATIDQLAEEIQDDMLIPADARIKSDKRSHRKQIVIGLSLLLASSLIVAFFAMLAGAGSGSGSGAGGGGNPGGSNSGGSGSSDGSGGGSGGSGEGGDGGNFFAPGGGGVPGGNGGEEDTTNLQLNILQNKLQDPTTVPHNPEPATLMLMLLGLGLPFLRKRLS